MKLREIIIPLNDPEDIYKCGIYKIFHVQCPDVLYIGSAAIASKYKCSSGFWMRLALHYSMLKRNLHHSKYLQRVVNKYGLDGIRMQILELAHPDEVLDLEQSYLDRYKPAYNSHTNAKNGFGYKHSPEVLAKMKQSRAGYRHSEETKARMREVAKGRSMALCQAASRNAALNRYRESLKRMSIEINFNKNG